jgi:hypothetical protein
MRVLLLDEGFVSGATAALGLHTAGCDVDVIAAVGGRASCRATGGVWRFAPKVGAPDLARHIELASRRERYDVIYPATEPLQRWLWPRRPAWPALRLPADDPTPPRYLTDKRQMSRLAGAAGIAIPEQTDRASESNIDEAIRHFGLPIVIKGAVGRGGRTTFIAASAAQARDAIRRIERRATDPFAQRYIPGTTFLVGGVFHQGLPVRLYAGEKRVQFPNRTGPAAVLVSTNDRDLIHSATRVFRAARITGLASADFIRDADGRFRFLELNPRPWGSMAAARQAGVDVFTPLVQLWQGAMPIGDLELRAAVRSAIFPLAALSPAAWASGDGPRSFAGAIADAIRRPDFAMHLVHRAARVARNW